MFRSICLAAFLSLAPSLFAADPPAQLLLPSRQLEANSTFEVRFASEMVKPEQIGKPVDVSPLVLEPAVPGRFVWLSTRSGSFAPEGVLPLGTNFKISLRAGLKDAAGKPVAATLRETAETPPFGVKGVSAVSYGDVDNAPVVPRYLVLFNAPVDAATAAKFSRFINDAGVRVEARVEQASDPRKPERRFPVWQSEDRSLAAWGEKADPPKSIDEEEDGAGEETDDELAPAKDVPPVRNVLYVAAANRFRPARTGASYSSPASRRRRGKRRCRS
jgi:hypothetical protein